jgi:tRNA A37 threonylcarbamoyladenosine synthetase subunit TsaC/SUA5/YrdC
LAYQLRVIVFGRYCQTQDAEGWSTPVSVHSFCFGHIPGVSYRRDDKSQYKIIHRLTPGPYVFILESLRKLEKLTGMKRREVGIRIPDDPVSIALIETLGEPMFSTTAAHAMEDQGWWDSEFAEENLFEMGWELETIRGIDMILDGGDALSKTLTTVLDLRGNDVAVIRHGLGPYEG